MQDLGCGIYVEALVEQNWVWDRTGWVLKKFEAGGGCLLSGRAVNNRPTRVGEQYIYTDIPGVEPIWR